MSIPRTVRECGKMLKFLESDQAMVHMILLEKDRQKLSYSDLVEKLKKKGSRWTEQFGGVTPSLTDRLKQSLHAKKPDKELLKDLCSALEIDDDMLHRIEGYRYKQQFGSRATQGGRPSAKTKEEKSRQCEKIKENVEASDGENGSTTIEEAVLHGFENIFYEEEWIEPDVYKMLIEDKKKKELIEKILLICEQQPAMLEDFLAQFEFVDDTL